MSLAGFGTLRARFLLVALVGVLLPIAVVALWLTNSAERAGRSLLREQLRTSADEVASTVAKRWEERQGDMQLLANNVAAERAIAGELRREDSVYLYRVASALSSSFADIRYIDAFGNDRWSAFRNTQPDDAFGSFQLNDSVSNAATPGFVRVRLRLSSLLPDSSTLLPAGGVATIRRHDELLWSSGSGVFDATTLDASAWEIEQRDVAGTGLTIAMASRVSPFVKPFEEATRRGLGILALVVLVVVVYTIYLTSRVTHATMAELSEKRALAAVGEFAASLSHEVRNCLTAIRVDLQNARRQVQQGDAVEPLLARTLDTVQRLDGSVTTALRMARGTAAVREPVSIRASLANAIETSAAVFAERGVTLVPPASTDDAFVAADASAIEQVFINVFLNAAEAMTPGGRAHIDVVLNGHRVSVRVTDTGGGFSSDPSAAGSRLFETTKLRGTGLGLPIARRITEMYGGSLRIENASRGAVVIIDLPTAPVTS